MQRRAAAALAVSLLWLASTCETVRTQPSSQTTISAMALARAIVDESKFQLDNSVAHKPRIAGPPGSFKLVSSWAASDTYEKLVMPRGAVALLTAGNGHPYVVELSFSVRVKVGIV
jgi:hypothetical protein